MKRLISVLLFLCLMASILCVSAIAVADEQNESAAIESAQDFLQKYIEETMLYSEQDLLSGTVVSADATATLHGNEPTFTLSSGVATLSDITKNINYVSNKADYYKGMRQLQNITRTNFETSYHVESASVSGNSAFVRISQVASFYYPQYVEQAIYETIYDVDLVKIDDEWLIADVTDNDWFDAEYKEADNLDVALMLREEALAMESAQETVVEETTPDIEPMTAGPYHIPYNQENAVAYAYNHTRQNTTDSRDVFYNKYFSRYDGDGGDCMNFASQCIYAGFSGSLNKTVIDSHVIPMDNDDTNQWYGSSADNKWTGSNSWTSCQNFRKYLTGNYDGTGTTGSINTTDIGLMARKIYVPASSGFGSADSAVTKENLPGSVAHVKNSNGPHAHAIVITDATGLERNQIRFCAHTTDKKYVLLGDDYSCAMRVYIPQYFRSNVALTNYLQVNMIRPFSVNTTKTISFSSTGQRSSMWMKITPPSGGINTIATATNARTCSASFRFNERGYYKVDCYAKTASNTEQCVTFQILVV